MDFIFYLFLFFNNAFICITPYQYNYIWILVRDINCKHFSSCLQGQRPHLPSLTRIIKVICAEFWGHCLHLALKMTLILWFKCQVQPLELIFHRQEMTLWIRKKLITHQNIQYSWMLAQSFLVLFYFCQLKCNGISESLGERLEAKEDPETLLPAMICYVCAGSLDKFVACWVKTRPQSSKPSELQVCLFFFIQ